MISRCSFPNSTEPVDRGFGAPQTVGRTQWQSQHMYTNCDENLQCRFSFSRKPAQGRLRVVQLWRSFPVFETVGDNAQCQSLCPRQRFVARGPVGEYAGKIDDLSEPAAICLLLELYFKRLFGHTSQPTTIIELLCPLRVLATPGPARCQ